MNLNNIKTELKFKNGDLIHLSGDGNGDLCSMEEQNVNFIGLIL